MTFTKRSSYDLSVLDFSDIEHLFSVFDAYSSISGDYSVFPSENAYRDLSEAVAEGLDLNEINADESACLYHLCDWFKNVSFEYGEDTEIDDTVDKVLSILSQ